MNEYQDGVPYRSEPVAYSAGSTVVVKLHFLEAARKMVAPVCAALEFRFTGTVNSEGTTNDAKGIDAAKLLGNVTLTDQGGDLIRASGESLRLNEIVELGIRQLDMVTLANGAADATRVWSIVFPYYLPKARRPSDTGLRLEHFLEGGQLQVTFGARPLGWDGFTGNLHVIAHMIDERKAEAKSRLEFTEENITLTEATYPINGSIRGLYLSSVLTTTSASSWASHTTINSTSFGWPANLETDVLLSKYRRDLDGIPSNDPFAVAATGVPTLGIPICYPNRRQKIGSMIDAKNIHLKLSAAVPTGAVLVKSVIKDRHVGLAATVLGYGDPLTYQAALLHGGHVVAANGKHKPVTAMISNLARRLPFAVPQIGG